MDKLTYYVIQEKNPETGAELAFCKRVRNCYNILKAFRPHDGFQLISVNACHTLKNAKSTADDWNAYSLQKGVYALSSDKIYPAICN